MFIVAILTTLLIFALIGFVVHLIVSYIPMPDIFKQVIIVCSAIFIITYIIMVISGKAQLVQPFKGVF